MRCAVALLWLLALPCAEAIHGLYNFGQHDLFYKKNHCKPIPASLLLCHDIEYTEMRLPNLLGHETMNEVLQQASSWIPLVQKQCHPDTRKFLCSLFAPVCLDDLDEAIQPCRSLCESVKHGCEPVMSAFGFPWPKMLDCERFPLDNDLCIPPAGVDSLATVTKEGAATDDFSFYFVWFVLFLFRFFFFERKKILNDIRHIWNTFKQFCFLIQFILQTFLV